METWVTIIISVLSLIVAVISLYKSNKAQALQEKINKLEIEIKEYDLNAIKEKENEKNSINIEARIIDVGNQKNKLRVCNLGQAIAYDVNVKLQKETGIALLDYDLLPYEELCGGKSFDIPAVLCFGNSRKFTVELSWKDSNKKEFSKSVLLSI